MILKKSNVLSRLEQLRALAEVQKVSDLMAKKVLDLLLDYLNDPQIREAVERIPF